jgi:galactofuranosylgalactofuranosylrhamnosyl-N-acetylglucosaminyl-diphospho-decaprenol beta-1,5/1,6-galactofuranosyltransferase
MAQQVLQRCVFPADRSLAALYYRLTDLGPGADPDGPPPGRFSIAVPPGATLTTDTYFNSFFEGYWRRYTRLGRLTLRLEISGTGTLQLLRRAAGRSAEPLRAVWFHNQADPLTLECPLPLAVVTEPGALHFALTATSGEVRLRRAEWVAAEARPDEVKLAVGFCTFNRAPRLLENVRALIGDADLAPVLHRVLVVDQGTDRVRRHPDFARLGRAARGRLRVIEQANYGGAGGFTRAILEARAHTAATHMLLMDDDSRLETESVFRLAAFLALARGPLAVGGPMLDLLRPTELYEAGTWLRPRRLALVNPIYRRCVRDLASVPALLRVTEPDYNSWWFFAFPLAQVGRVGLPLPLFLRGDDAEFGCRLRARGVPTVTVPGLSVWHEPFYRKKGGWHPYYDLRNMLILTAVHRPQPWYRIAKVFLQRVVSRLLCANYFQASILCDALADYCRGPSVVRRDPRLTHEKLLASQAALGPQQLPDSSALPPVRPAPAPRSRLAVSWYLLRGLLRQVLRRSPPPEQPMRHLLVEGDAGWWSLSTADVVGVLHADSGTVTVHRRSRAKFLRIFGRVLAAVGRLALMNRRVQRAWRADFPQLTGTDFWKRYLQKRSVPARETSISGT